MGDGHSDLAHLRCTHSCHRWYSAYLLSWYKSTNTDAAAGGAALGVWYSVYLLYWCKITNTDSAASGAAPGVWQTVALVILSQVRALIEP